MNYNLGDNPCVFSFCGQKSLNLFPTRDDNPKYLISPLALKIALQ
jgi:hypothetical protein